jgi:hypothetical protein
MVCAATVRVSPPPSRRGVGESYHCGPASVHCVNVDSLSNSKKHRQIVELTGIVILTVGLFNDWVDRETLFFSVKR